MIANLRSDTFTKPTPDMLEAMMNAEVGDDVFGEDPTVNKLEEMSASMFGMESALFCPSGTMTNQIAIRIHTTLQDEVICDWRSHIYQYEGGGIASNSGVSVKLLEGDRGRISADQISKSINPQNDIHKPASQLVVLENTMNRGGGSYYNFEEITKIKTVCNSNNMAFHLDGARLFNALIETNEAPEQYGNVFDSISICLSKGLGAPIGSLLIGTAQQMQKARRVRKVFGGGMRQAGSLAAAGIYALNNNIDRLKHDHKRAKVLGETLEKLGYVDQVTPIDTNIVIYSLQSDLNVANHLSALNDLGVQALPFGDNDIRMITHLDFNDEMLEHTLKVLNSLN